MKPIPTYVQDPERQRILNQAIDARTLPEIATAIRELTEWVRNHPEDVGIRDAFEGLSLMQDIAEEQEAECTQAMLIGQTQRPMKTR